MASRVSVYQILLKTQAEFRAVESVFHFRADSDLVTLEVRGNNAQYYRVIASKINKRPGNPPVINYDTNKFMLRYDWPAMQRDSIRTQERIQMRLANPQDMPTLVALLTPHFELSGLLKAKGAQNAILKNYDTPDDSQVKRPRPEGSLNDQARSREDESQNLTDESLPRKRYSASPLLETQARLNRYVDAHTDDPPLDRTVKARSNSQIDQPPWLAEENDPSRPIREEWTVKRADSPLRPAAETQGADMYPAMLPTRLAERHPPLIDFTDPQQANMEKHRPDVNELTVSHSKEASINRTQQPKDEREDDPDSQLSLRFPPIRPSTALTRSSMNGLSVVQKAMSGMPNYNIQLPMPQAGGYSLHTSSMQSSSTAGSFMPPGKGVYDLTDAELEAQIGDILHEQGFVSLVHQVSAILNKRQAIKDLQEYSSLIDRNTQRDQDMTPVRDLHQVPEALRPQQSQEQDSQRAQYAQPQDYVEERYDPQRPFFDSLASSNSQMFTLQKMSSSQSSLNSQTTQNRRSNLYVSPGSHRMPGLAEPENDPFEAQMNSS